MYIIYGKMQTLILSTIKRRGMVPWVIVQSCRLALMNKFSTVMKGVEFEEGDLFVFILSAMQ